MIQNKLRLFVLVATIGFSPIAALAQTAGNNQNVGVAFSISGEKGTPDARYTVHADNVDLMDFLRTVAKDLGYPKVEGAVNGTISIHLRDLAIADLWNNIEVSANPPVKLSAGKTLIVTRDPAFTAVLLQQRMNAIAAGKYLPPNFGTGPGSGLNGVGSQIQTGLMKPVTLQIPDEAPISLSSALQMLERQSGMSIVLDARISTNIKFIASVSNMPLGLLLDRIAPSTGYGSLKWYLSGNRIIIAPSDRLELRSGNNVIGSTIFCTQCHSPLGLDWSYCSNCGLITPRGQMVPKKLPPPVGSRKG
ncbi:MAG: zinc ribbon domain-containing protein [Chthonomonadales bacterium]